jgi:colanic acid biosynthesis glycosyl transferase WcaI
MLTGASGPLASEFYFAFTAGEEVAQSCFPFRSTMRILLLNQSFAPDSTATAQHLADLARHLHSAGHQVIVLADRRNYESRDAAYPAREQWHDIDVRRVATTWFGKHSFAGRLVDGVSFLIMLSGKLFFVPRPDIVVSFTSPPLLGLLGAIYARVVGARPVHWLMDLNIDAAIATGSLADKSLFTRLLLRAFRWSLSQSEVVIVEDRLTMERAALRGARRMSVVIIPPWPAHEASPADDAARDAFRSEHGVEDAFVVMFSGNHAAVHPLDTLLAAIQRLDGDGFLFLFIGAGDRVRDVSAAIHGEGLRNVKQLPLQTRDRLGGTLKAADVHLVVMGNEMNGLGHPSKMYGVLAAGKPYVFIGPKNSFAGDILAECPYGFAVEHGDVEGLVSALRSARDLSPSQRETYREANIAYLARRFGRERSLAIFDEAVFGAQPTAASSMASQMSAISSDRSESDEGR